MPTRFFRSRPARKFLRNRLATAGLAVIGVYVLIGLACWLGYITAEGADQRVGPDAVTGFLESQPPEKRFKDADFFLSAAESALKKRDWSEAAREAGFAERRLAPLEKDAVREIVDDARATYDELDELGSLDPTPEVEAKLAQIEAGVQRLFPVPGGAAGQAYAFRMLMGTDRQGRSIMLRGLYSVGVALKVGLVVAGVSVAIGALLGSAAAYLGGWVDHAVQWLYSTFSSIPNLVLLALVAYVLGQPLAMPWGQVDLSATLVPVYVALCLTFWIGTCRVVRGEVLKIRELEYVQAARAIGFPRIYILLRHVLPNTAHLMLINFSLLFIGAIKTEVVLTFLGLGVKQGASWGIMITQAGQEVINGFFWQIGWATFLMFFLVLAFNVVSDALQDAFDPKHVG